MVPVRAITDLLIITMAARHELPIVALKVLKIHGLARIFFKTAPPLQKEGAKIHRCLNLCLGDDA